MCDFGFVSSASRPWMQSPMATTFHLLSLSPIVMAKLPPWASSSLLKPSSLLLLLLPLILLFSRFFSLFVLVCRNRTLECSRVIISESAIVVGDGSGKSTDDDVDALDPGLFILHLV